MRCISRSIILLASLAGALPAGAPPAGAPSAGAPPAAAPPGCITVAGDRILLADLAPSLPGGAVDEPSRAVGFAPRPGVRRTLLFREWSGGGRARLPGEPDEICVEREARPLDGDEVAAALAAAFAGSGDAIAIAIEDLPKGRVPPGRLVFSPADLRLARPAPHTGVVQIHGHVAYGGDPARPLRFPIWVRARVEAEVSRIELTCPLEAGGEITPACMKATKARAYPFASEAASPRIEALAGREARRRLAVGAMLQEVLFHPRRDVKAHEEINLLVRSGRAVLRLKAASESGGAVGEMITVRAAGARQTLRARVTAPGAAEYLLPAAADAAPKGTDP